MDIQFNAHVSFYFLNFSILSGFQDKGPTYYKLAFSFISSVIFW